MLLAPGPGAPVGYTNVCPAVTLISNRRPVFSSMNPVLMVPAGSMLACDGGAVFPVLGQSHSADGWTVVRALSAGGPKISVSASWVSSKQ